MGWSCNGNDRHHQNHQLRHQRHRSGLLLPQGHPGKGKELGLDGFRFYILGRGGVLGDVEAPVIASAFAYFHPTSVDKVWNSAKERMAPRQAAQAYGLCCAAVGRSTFADVDGLEAYNDAAETVVGATDPAGLTLFAGWAAEQRVDDAPGRAMQLAAVLRELRGSAHIIAVLASGLSAGVAHAAKRPDDVATFGWDPAPEVTDEHRVSLDRAEILTDQLLVPSYASISDEQAEALIAGTAAMSSALGF